MKKNNSRFFITLILVAMFQLVSADLFVDWAFAEKGNKKETESGKLLNRIDFGNSYIMGQTVKSGAVYLLQRKQSEIKTMLKYRENYREEILEGFSVKEKIKNEK